MIKNVILGFIGVLVSPIGQVDSVMVDLVAKLRAKGAKVWVVSSVKGERDYYLNKHPFLKDTDGFHLVDKMGLNKHSADTYMKLCAMDGLLTPETLFFDDSEKAVAAAGKAGIESHFFHDAVGFHQVLKKHKISL